jgi:hypothetical protein
MVNAGIMLKLNSRTINIMVAVWSRVNFAYFRGVKLKMRLSRSWSFAFEVPNLEIGNQRELA